MCQVASVRIPSQMAGGTFDKSFHTAFRTSLDPPIDLSLVGKSCIGNLRRSAGLRSVAQERYTINTHVKDANHSISQISKDRSLRPT